MAKWEMVALPHAEKSPIKATLVADVASGGDEITNCGRENRFHCWRYQMVIDSKYKPRVLQKTFRQISIL
jgi:hypothetical protein